MKKRVVNLVFFLSLIILSIFIIGFGIYYSYYNKPSLSSPVSYSGQSLISMIYERQKAAGYAPEFMIDVCSRNLDFEFLKSAVNTLGASYVDGTYSGTGPVRFMSYNEEIYIRNNPSCDPVNAPWDCYNPDPSCFAPGCEYYWMYPPEQIPANCRPLIIDPTCILPIGDTNGFPMVIPHLAAENAQTLSDLYDILISMKQTRESPSCVNSRSKLGQGMVAYSIPNSLELAKTQASNNFPTSSDIPDWTESCPIKTNTASGYRQPGPGCTDPVLCYSYYSAEVKAVSGKLAVGSNVPALGLYNKASHSVDFYVRAVFPANNQDNVFYPFGKLPTNYNGESFKISSKPSSFDSYVVSDELFNLDMPSDTSSLFSDLGKEKGFQIEPSMAIITWDFSSVDSCYDKDQDGISTNLNGDVCYSDAGCYLDCNDNIGVDDAGNTCPDPSTSLIDCSKDDNHNGIPDYSSCGFCINPFMAEIPDDIDNNCQGSCQRDSSISCRVTITSGDGENSDYYCLDSGDSRASANSGNNFQGQDSFCQMVDENICGPYERPVLWAQALKDIGSSDPNCNEFIQYSFIPGGRAESVMKPLDTECSIKKIIRNLPYNPNLPIQPICTSSEEISLADFKNPSNSESIAITRGTQDLPQQFIDSVRGECNFDEFWTKYSAAANKPDLVWFTSCVRKDKCADSGDNNGVVDLFNTAPYGNYFHPVDVDQLDANGNVISSLKTKEFFMKLADKDDPDCKFSSVPSTNSNPVPYTSPIYKSAPYQSWQPYCEDKDFDGFCVNSALFPDCDDDSSDDNQYVYPSSGIGLPLSSNIITPGGRIKILPDLGWGDSSSPYIGKELGAWYVHPFAASMGCSSYFDLNCNKGGIQGYNYPSLLEPKWNPSDTPFDNDPNTGIDGLHIGCDTTDNNLANTFYDAKCVYKSGSQQIADQFATLFLNNALQVVPIKPYLLVVGGIFTIKAVFTDKSIREEIINYFPDFYKCAKSLFSGNLLGSPSITKEYNGFMVTDFSNEFQNCLNRLRQTTDIGYMIEGYSISRPLKITSVPKNSPENTKKTVLSIKQEKEKLVNTEKCDSCAPNPGCFLENTKIRMSDGTMKNIQDVEFGDSVLAYDLENNKPVIANITATFIRNETSYREITYEVIE